MRSVDQMGNIFHFKATPSRIVSLVPSISELLCDIGMESKIVGCTKFCVHPIHLKSKKTIVGGTKKVHVDKVKSLQPDIIIGNKEENNREDIESLKYIANVWMSDVKTIKDSIDLINSLGEIFNTQEKSNQINEKTECVLSRSKVLNGRVVYLIWKNPLMTIGGDTFINNMLENVGLENAFQKKERYPATTIEEIKEINPDYIFLSSEPFPFKEKHRLELSEKLQNDQVHLVDGEYFSWYGSRILNCSDYPNLLMQEMNFGHKLQFN